MVGQSCARGLLAPKHSANIPRVPHPSHSLVSCINASMSSTKASLPQINRAAQAQPSGLTHSSRLYFVYLLHDYLPLRSSTDTGFVFLLFGGKPGKREHYIAVSHPSTSPILELRFRHLRSHLSKRDPGRIHSPPLAQHATWDASRPRVTSCASYRPIVIRRSIAFVTCR
ncbi:hypothetical protein VTI74DRAFT_3025 [Chaetomium olivicolor]